MFPQSALLPASGDGLPFFGVLDIVLNHFDALFRRAVGHDLAARFEHLRQVWLPVGDEQTAGAGSIEETPVARIDTRSLDMLVQGDSRFSQDLRLGVARRHALVVADSGPIVRQSL